MDCSDNDAHIIREIIICLVITDPYTVESQFDALRDHDSSYVLDEVFVAI